MIDLDGIRMNTRKIYRFFFLFLSFETIFVFTNKKNNSTTHLSLHVLNNLKLIIEHRKKPRSFQEEKEKKNQQLIKKKD